MKIDHSQSIPKPIESKTKANPQAAAFTQRKNAKGPDVSRQRIGSWFTQVGISPNAELSNYKQRTAIAYRHADIRRVKKAENLRSIMTISMEVAVGDVSEENLDPDWFHSFIDLAENIYSPAMQELWGKILAVEVSRPGSFSLRSLETLKLLTQKDAQLFSTACSLATRRAGDPVPRIIGHYHQRKTLSSLFFNHTSDPINLASFGLSYPNLLALIDLGLIMPSEIESAEFPLSQAISFKCGESTFSLTAKRSGVALSYYKFSTTGAELYLLAKKHENTEYFNTLKHTLSRAFNVGA